MSTLGLLVLCHLIHCVTSIHWGRGKMLTPLFVGQVQAKVSCNHFTFNIGYN